MISHVTTYPQSHSAAAKKEDPALLEKQRVNWENIRQASIKLWQLLQKIPLNDRPKFARTHLDPKLSGIIKVFEAIPREKLAKTVLYLSTKTQTRETRMAVAASPDGIHCSFIPAT